VESSCEFGFEPSSSIKCLGNYRVAYQLVASRVVLSSTELLSSFVRSLVSYKKVLGIEAAHKPVLGGISKP
jgi:hypothetical protein